MIDKKINLKITSSGPPHFSDQEPAYRLGYCLRLLAGSIIWWVSIQSGDACGDDYVRHCLFWQCLLGRVEKQDGC